MRLFLLIFLCCPASATQLVFVDLPVPVATSVPLMVRDSSFDEQMFLPQGTLYVDLLASVWTGTLGSEYMTSWSWIRLTDSQGRIVADEVTPDSDWFQGSISILGFPLAIPVSGTYTVQAESRETYGFSPMSLPQQMGGDDLRAEVDLYGVNALLAHLVSAPEPGTMWLMSAAVVLAVILLLLRG